MKALSGVAAEQRKPRGKGGEVLPLVIADLKARSGWGLKKYGERLKVFNGRDSLMDAYQEVLDLAMYIRQEIEKRARRNEHRKTRSNAARHCRPGRRS